MQLAAQAHALTEQGGELLTAAPQPLLPKRPDADDDGTDRQRDEGGRLGEKRGATENSHSVAASFHTPSVWLADTWKR